MPKLSAGLLVFRCVGDGLELLLVHPGGPYWAKRDDGAWSIPKGEYEVGEDPLDAARREFREELGTDAPNAGSAIPLGEIRQRSGKRVTAWAVEGDLDPATVRSNTFTMEWPPRSGRSQEFPEVDRARWFDPETAGRKLVSGQAGLVERLLGILTERD
jgi:predicted NUDIX family NTP pyrophosphohydrolase